jgi:NADH:ubiquinone oxidoreductase subunit 6 (subunit J)
MTIAQIAFYGFAALTLVSGLFILFTKNVLYAGFALLATFLGVAALYVFAGADFLAVTQLLIYVGGVLVLILFGIMLTNRTADQDYIYSENRNLTVGILSAGSLLAILVAVILKAKFSSLAWMQKTTVASKMEASTLNRIGENLMTDYVLPFEVAGLILMVALMGAAFIASQTVKK